MRMEQAFFPLGVRMATVGGVVWLSLLAGVLLHRFRLSIFDLLFLLAPWVVVPLGLGLIPAERRSRLSRWAGLAVRYSLFPGAALTTVGFFLKDGRAAGAMVSLWLLATVSLAIDGLDRFIRARLGSFKEFCFAIGEGYAVVGALWLLASRVGLRPIGFHEPIVLLTAIHFHYAGFMAAILAGQVAANMGTFRRLLPLRGALACAVLGPGLLGLAFLAGPKIKLAAVAVMAIGECGIALGTFGAGLSNWPKMGGSLLLIVSASVVFGIGLAGIWAVGEYPLHAFVNLEQMARYHGILNSLGFGLCSLAGWTLVNKRPRLAQELLPGHLS